MFCYVLGIQFLHNLSIRIGSSPSDHTQCASRTEKIPLNTNVTLPCEGTGRYVSIKKVGGDRIDAMYFCEVVVTGYKYRGTYSVPMLVLATILELCT